MIDVKGVVKAIAIAVLIYLFLATRANLKLILQIKPWFFAILLVFPAIAIIFWVWRWGIFMNALGEKKNFKDFLLPYIAGLAFIATPGKSGELLKADVMKRVLGISYEKSIACIILERVNDALSFAFVATLLSFLYPKYFLIGLAGIAFALAIVFVFIFGKWEIIIPEKFKENARNIRKNAKKLLKIMHISMIPTIFATLGAGLIPYLILRYFGYNVNYMLVLLAVLASSIVGNLFLLPGGAGALEGTFAGVLSLAKVPFSTALTVIMLTRFISFWLLEVLGIATLLKLYS